MKYEIKDGELHILEDAPGIKFKKAVEQITYSGDYGMETGSRFITLRNRLF
ncbi:MAG: hypothetical protein ACLSFZ_01065 [Frisingicoccus sp.]